MSSSGEIIPPTTDADLVQLPPPTQYESSRSIMPPSSNREGTRRGSTPARRTAVRRRPRRPRARGGPVAAPSAGSPRKDQTKTRPGRASCDDHLPDATSSSGGQRRGLAVSYRRSVGGLRTRVRPARPRLPHSGHAPGSRPATAGAPRAAATVVFLGGTASPTSPASAEHSVPAPTFGQGARRPRRRHQRLQRHDRTSASSSQRHLFTKRAQPLRHDRLRPEQRGRGARGRGCCARTSGRWPGESGRRAPGRCCSASPYQASPAPDRCRTTSELAPTRADAGRGFLGGGVPAQHRRAPPRPTGERGGRLLAERLLPHPSLALGRR